MLCRSFVYGAWSKLHDRSVKFVSDSARAVDYFHGCPVIGLVDYGGALIPGSQEHVANAVCRLPVFVRIKVDGCRDGDRGKNSREQCSC